MEVSKELKDFISAHSEDIDNNRFTNIYKDFLKLIYEPFRMFAADVGTFTKILYNAGIDPLIHMDEIPEYFLAKQYLDNFTTPNNIRVVKAQAFLNSTIEKITISNSVVIIENHAFSDCHNLKSVNFGTGLKLIGEDIFIWCPMERIYVKYNGTMEQWKNIEIIHPQTSLIRAKIHCKDGNLIYNNYITDWVEN